jgi:predicted RNA polymerase sigma factor
MKYFATPRRDAADLAAFFRARAIDRLRRKADNAAALKRNLDRDAQLRDRLRHEDSPGTSQFWILHAR